MCRIEFLFYSDSGGFGILKYIKTDVNGAINKCDTLWAVLNEFNAVKKIVNANFPNFFIFVKFD